MNNPSQAMVGDSNGEIDANGVSGDCDYSSLQKRVEGEDVGSNNTATASISSSSSLSSSEDNNAASSSISTSSDGIHDKNLWWIHGNGYDLKDFVENHPGGVEAILLGKGRDCTALVESYHAFSGERVWKILEKYRSATNRQEDEDEREADEFATGQGITLPSTEQHNGRVPDFFYELLKERVTNVLRSKGIDPVKDRGASKTRTAYYLVVLISWLYTGYLHCSVSFSCRCFKKYKPMF